MLVNGQILVSCQLQGVKDWLKDDKYFKRSTNQQPGVRLVSGRTSVQYCFSSPFSSKRLWFVDTVLWFCPSLPTETLKWLSSLPTLVQKSFWWWHYSNRYIISLFSHLHTPFSPSLKAVWFLWMLSTMFTYSNQWCRLQLQATLNLDHNKFFPSFFSLLFYFPFTFIST